LNLAYHIPVLLHESVSGLALQPGGRYVDCTFGGGGHSREILNQLQDGQLVAFDKDPDARENMWEDERLVFVAEDFQFIETALQSRDLLPVDGILADLGISSHQIDTAGRGFSFRFDAPLDMRMNRQQPLGAAELLNDYEEEEIAQVLHRFGEVPGARKAARLIVEQRQRSRLQSTSDLETALRGAMPRQRQAKYLAQVYQALRIAVNGELEGLAKLLVSSLPVLKPGGRLAVISYHSLEDRMVKRFLRSGNFTGKDEKNAYGHSLSPWKLITRKAIMPSPEEIERNPRARSARLRIAEKLP
jgi:16S rRNA (cytosine1402-N4)-methyltransferase